MGFKFELRFADGDDAGSFETAEANWKTGDTVIAHGNRWFRVVSVVRSSGSLSSSTNPPMACSSSSHSSHPSIRPTRCRETPRSLAMLDFVCLPAAISARIRSRN
jgi:hypothetical protein